MYHWEHVLRHFAYLSFTIFILVCFVSGYFRVRLNRRRIRQENARMLQMSWWYGLTPPEFERALANLCTRDGCRVKRIHGGAGDRGADVIAITPDNRRLIIQAKHYTNGHKVGSPDMQRFAGTAFAIHNADIACLVTTGQFTRQALDIARSLGILAYDNRMLAAWAANSGPTPWR